MARRDIWQYTRQKIRAGMGRSVKRLVWLAMGCTIALLTAILTAIPASALIDSTGDGGIEARRLQAAPYDLTGRKIAIGQVEVGRPAQFGLDKPASQNRSVRPRGLFFRDQRATPDQYVDEHAASVASVMISQDKTLRGVAPNAKLYSAAAGTGEAGEQPEECLASQTVALQNGGDVRAINFSFGESLERDPRPEPVLDGNALLTQCVDWSARVHNVVYVIAGNQGRGGIPIPTDTFNGMTIANSMEKNGVFDRIQFYSLGSEPRIVVGRDPSRESNEGSRRSVVLTAPGDRLQTIAPDGSTAASATGTSFAAPHVTATVALLQEYGDRAMRLASTPLEKAKWNLNARQQEVTRAVLMNSADKMKDAGDGKLLGMTRTFLDLEGQNWLESDAYKNREIPLDAETGTGHLNAFRAITQFSPGQMNADAPVAAVGWDYGKVGDRDADLPRFRDYVIDTPLQAGSYISITLAWNRWVELEDKNKNELYDLGETFLDRGLNNLDVYLMKANDNSTRKSIWSSVSKVDSQEHIFHQIPETGQYKIRVLYRDRVHEPTQAYGLAWWAVSASR